MAMQQYTTRIQCPKCNQHRPVSFKATSKKAFFRECVVLQNTTICGTCKDKENKTPGQDKKIETAARELQMSGLSEMYRPTSQKPHVLTDENGKRTFMKHETRTERTLRECSAP